MIIRYSACHFAEVIDHWFVEKTMPPVRQWTPKCSFCGEFCEVVPTAHTLDHDLELTLRRWKDGDCTLDDMFDRVNKELQRSYDEAFDTAASTLQADRKPKFTRAPFEEEWHEPHAG